MILIGNSNNTSKKIKFDDISYEYPIKFGRKNNTAINVIKILIGDSSNIAREAYFLPLYDYRANTKLESDLAQEYGNSEIFALYKDDLSNRDPSEPEKSVDTLLLQGLMENSDSYLLNQEINKNLDIYAPYVKNITFSNTDITTVHGLCTSLTGINYSSIEYLIFPYNLDFISSFNNTPNLKQINFTGNSSVTMYNSLNNHFDGLIILCKPITYDSLISLESLISPVLLIYQYGENNSYISDSLITINANNDNTIIASSYFSIYDSKEEFDNILGNN